MTFDRKSIIALIFCAAASFAPPCFGQGVQSAAPDKGLAGRKIAAPAPAALLDINTASLEDLRALKGIGDKRAADVIKNRPYKGKDDLVQRKIIPAAVYAGIKDKIIAKQN
ncbi:ComEA family DNA-binding protein [Methylocapsa aurea]|uniref:ComEA family DNA-binding protein n=1 Tax=Methylocapsa aurea TaxID=663610 RepID=UPI000569E213|nr:helix-hairpin-helix domain-containing protein [Methylocapsa aurea]